MTNKRSIDLEASAALGNIVKQGTKSKIAIGKKLAKGLKKTEPSKGKAVKEKKTETAEAPAKNPSPSKITEPAPAKKPGRKSTAITKGPEATHARNMDTGKTKKLTPAQREAVTAYYKRNTPVSGPAVNLEDTFEPRQFSVTAKRSAAK